MAGTRPAMTMWAAGHDGVGRAGESIVRPLRIIPALKIPLSATNDTTGAWVKREALPGYDLKQ